MQKYEIGARCKRKFVATTDSKYYLPIAPDLLQRNFTAGAPIRLGLATLPSKVQ